MKTTAVSTRIFHPNWRALCYVRLFRHWLPHIFAGKFVTATFWFNQHDRLSRHKLTLTLLS